MRQSILIHIKKHLPKVANIIDKRSEMRSEFEEKMNICFPDVPRRINKDSKVIQDIVFVLCFGENSQFTVLNQ